MPATSPGVFTQQFRRIPTLHTRHWALVIQGAVRHPLILDYQDVTAYPADDISAAIICAHQPAAHMPDSPLVYDAHFHGVALARILADVHIAPAVTGAALHAADGYTATLTLDQLRSAYLVLAMNGAPLPPEHGFPARIVIPGLYGFKMPKWIERIYLSAAPQPGTWESRGWNQDQIQPLVTLQTPLRDSVLNVGEPAALYGFGYGLNAAPHVMIDEIAIPVRNRVSDAGALMYWEAAWRPTIPGDYRLRVQAAGQPSAAVVERVLHVR
ncbi:MAG: molybdopterin-dependent oxidoreductase [bacterium]|nr:molybdopterin-dependent oxidoreductase [bacterium]